MNEIDPREGFVELLDLSPPGAGNEAAAQEYPKPLPFSPRTPFVMSIALPAGGGQVCFERPRDSSLPFEEYRYHCMGYGEVTKPAMRRLQLGPRRLPMPVAPFPPPGESVQRQPCGKAAVARSTADARRASACTSRQPTWLLISTRLPSGSRT